jgi:hypothetical protein
MKVVVKNQTSQTNFSAHGLETRYMYQPYLHTGNPSCFQTGVSYPAMRILILYTVIWRVLRMTGCNLIVLSEYIIFIHLQNSMSIIQITHITDILNFWLLLHCMFKCSCIIRMCFFNIYNLRHFRILWNFTCTIFETVFVLFLYCVFVLLLCCVLSCILYFETCFIFVVRQVFLFMKWIFIDVCIGLCVKYPLFLSDFNVTWILSIYFRKMLIYQISWKSVQWKPSCSTQTDGQTEMMRPTVAFLNVCTYQVLCAML